MEEFNSVTIRSDVFNDFREYCRKNSHKMGSLLTGIVATWLENVQRVRTPEERKQVIAGALQRQKDEDESDSLYDEEGVPNV